MKQKAQGQVLCHPAADGVTGSLIWSSLSVSGSRRFSSHAPDVSRDPNYS